jgi:hypothetical protein
MTTLVPNLLDVVDASSGFAANCCKRLAHCMHELLYSVKLFALEGFFHLW